MTKSVDRSLLSKRYSDGVLSCGFCGAVGKFSTFCSGSEEG